MNESGGTQISTTDPDSRQMITRNNITEVGYNIQTTVDDKNKLIIDYHVTNTNDSKAMGEMLGRAGEVLGHHKFTALYDKGYHTGSEIKTAIEMGVKVMVAIPGVASHAPDHNYDLDQFKYNKKKDQYTCPQGHVLSTNGQQYIKSKERSTYYVKHYKTAQCLTCPVKSLCTKNERGRLIERNEYQEYVDTNRKNIEKNKELYRKRQQIVEHPYGTIKRQWGYSYIMTKKSIQHASADVGLIMTAYNLRRLFNIFDQNSFKAWLKALASIIELIFDYFNAIRDLIFAKYLVPPILNQQKITA